MLSREVVWKCVPEAGVGGGRGEGVVQIPVSGKGGVTK